MSDRLKEHFADWKLTYLYIAFFSFNSLGTVILAALQGVTWNTLDTQAKVLIVVAVFVNWSSMMMALASKVAKSAKEGRSILDENGNGTKT